MTFVRDHWKWLLAVTIVALIGIQVFEPDYNKLQTAKDADAFRAVLGDGRGGAIAANLSDFVFAAGYGVLGFLAFRSIDNSRRGLIGASIFAGAAVADEIENVFVLRNLIGSDETTDGWIDAMRAVGTVKTTLLLLGLGAFAGTLVVRAINRRRASS